MWRLRRGALYVTVCLLPRLLSVNDSELATIKARAEAATPGPWEWGGDVLFGRDNWDGPLLATRVDGQRPEDADFIAYARADVEVLLAEVERLRGLVP